MARRNGGFVGQDGLDAPDIPTGVAGTAGELSVSVAFTAPSDAGTSAITNFVAQVSIDDTAYSAGSNTGTSSPIVVSSLTAGTAATAKVWAINAYGTSAPSDASASFTPLALPRAIIHLSGGSNYETLEFVDMGTSGNTTDFCDLTEARIYGSALGSSPRGVFGGGYPGSDPNTTSVIDYVTIASTGNATDFGDLSSTRSYPTGLSSNTRGLFGGGAEANNAYTDTIEYITIANTGNATDFGNLSTTYDRTSAASPTRGVFLGGNTNVIEYVTIANTGNTTDFGDFSAALRLSTACASNTRLLSHGYLNGAVVNTIEYITIANTGNSTDFGGLTAAVYNCGATSNNTLGIFMGGVPDRNSIDKVTIASTGNASDLGDLSANAIRRPQATSSAHGGIA